MSPSRVLFVLTLVLLLIATQWAPIVVARSIKINTQVPRTQPRSTYTPQPPSPTPTPTPPAATSTATSDKPPLPSQPLGIPLIDIINSTPRIANAILERQFLQLDEAIRAVICKEALVNTLRHLWILDSNTTITIGASVDSVGSISNANGTDGSGDTGNALNAGEPATISTFSFSVDTLILPRNTIADAQLLSLLCRSFY